MDDSKVVQRIVQELGYADLVERFGRLAGADLSSLLLQVFQTRAKQRKAADVFRQATAHASVRPSSLDARRLHDFDRVALSIAEGHEAVELSPIGPMGACQVLSRIDQNNVLSAVRNAEVVADPTVAQALECAIRRRDARTRRSLGAVRLCCSHRVLRLQPFHLPGYTPHFRVFSLVTAGHDGGDDRFETDSLLEHLSFYLRLFEALAAHGFKFLDTAIEISDTQLVAHLLALAGVAADEIRQSIRTHDPSASQEFLSKRGLALPNDVVDADTALSGVVDLAKDSAARRFITRLDHVRERVIDPLARLYPHARIRFNLSRLEGIGYYNGLCLKVNVRDCQGIVRNVADGGFTDWTQVLLNDRKERLLTSGIGSETVCRNFQRQCQGL